MKAKNPPKAAGVSNPTNPSRRFLIVGCQRTGTTLLRLVLECHSHIFCFDEEKAYLALRDDTVKEAEGSALVGFKIPSWTEQLDDDWLYDVGLGLWCKHFYRREPIVFLLRDVREVVASMMDLKLFGLNWWSALGSLTLRMKLKSPAFRKRYHREIQDIGDPNVNQPAAAALYWKYKTQAYFDYKEKGWPVYGVLYERLVTSPAQEISRILGFLGLKWEDSLLTHSQLPHTELDQEGKAMGQTDPTRPIDHSSLERWRERLSSSDVDQILAVAQDLNIRISQKPEATRPAGYNSPARTERPGSTIHKKKFMSDKLETMLAWLAERDRTALVLTAQLARKDQELQQLTAELASRKSGS